jgi:lipid A disaccharide synthetase
METVKGELETHLKPFIKALEEMKAENAALKKELATVEKREDSLTIHQSKAYCDLLLLRDTIRKAIAEARAFSTVQQVGDIGQRIVDIVERAVATPN